MEMEKMMENRERRSNRPRPIRIPPHGNLNLTLSPHSTVINKHTELAQLMDGTRLYALYQCAGDPYEFQRGLNSDQRSVLERHIEKVRADEQDDFNSQILRGMLGELKQD